MDLVASSRSENIVLFKTVLPSSIARRWGCELDQGVDGSIEG